MAPVTDSAGAALERLLDIMRALRAPDGCPWDREQTLASLRPFVLEETYEVLEAIEHGTPADLCEELGDFVFEAVFLAQISEEAGEFSLRDALAGICDKLIRRHPHVFERRPGASGLTSDQVVERWDALKARERALAGRGDGSATPRPKGTLDGVPKTLPALLRAFELSSRAANVGFDWAGAGDVLDKLDEEVAEVRREVEAGALGHMSPAEDEVGDLLFTVANLARKLGVEPESALRRANAKFVRRFEAVERGIQAQGRSLRDASLDELEAEWQRVKRQDESTPGGRETSPPAPGGRRSAP
jgi:nucleoside triphosphate diphosphatase